MNLRSEIVAWALAFITLVAIVLLLLTGKTVPPELYALVTLAGGGALGLGTSTSAAVSIPLPASPVVSIAEVAAPPRNDQAAPPAP